MMVSRPELTVALETVTPLFLAGAHPRGDPELRPPAFRGAMRYWLRAALGGVLSDDLEAMREREAEVFGRTEEKSARGSAVSVRIHSKHPSEPQPYSKARSVIGPRGERQPAARDYLYWSMAKSGNPARENYQPSKNFLPDGVAFDLTLTIRPGAQNAENAFRWARAALWLLVHLGGVGSRARRTGGSLSATGARGDETYPFLLHGRTAEEVAEQLEKGLERVRSEFSAAGSDEPSRLPAFDVLHPDWCRVWVLGVWPTADQAIEAIGNALRDFRNRREPDHRNMASWLKGGTIDGVERSVFGLPIPVRYTNRLSDVIQARNRNGTIDRRASPLWLRVSKSADGVYAGVATLFKSRFLPEGAQLRAGDRSNSVSPPRGYHLIEEFITDKFPRAIEVKYA
jgi:CRISPR-associated protein Cmr1